MKKLGAKGMKTLKVFHLLFVMIWLVGVLSTSPLHFPMQFAECIDNQQVMIIKQE